MSAQDVVERLHDHGVTVFLDSQGVVLRVPHAIPDELLEAARTHKGELAALLVAPPVQFTCLAPDCDLPAPSPTGKCSDHATRAVADWAAQRRGLRPCPRCGELTGHRDGPCLLCVFMTLGVSAMTVEENK